MAQCTSPAGGEVTLDGSRSFDPDGDPLTITAVGTPNRGGRAMRNDSGTPGDPSDDWIDYTPRAGFVGTETFSYTVQDSTGLESTAIVTVTLAPALMYSDGFEGGAGN